MTHLPDARLAADDPTEVERAHLGSCVRCRLLSARLRRAMDATPIPTGVPNVRPEARYRDDGLLGRGGMAEVRVAWDVRLERSVALKRPLPHLRDDPVAIARFLREAQLTAGLQHPGIVAVHSLEWDADGDPFYTMRKVEGRTLREAMDAHPGSPRWLEAWLRACETVGYAHARGVVHRDLKPENLLVGAHGEVLVVDWGLAGPSLASGSASTDPRLTRQGDVAGTPAYMSPEQALGQATAGPAQDVWSLGAILYELITGAPAFPGQTADEVLARVRTTDVTPLGPELPRDLAAVVARALARDPTLRYPHAGELAVAAQACFDGSARRERALRHVEAAREADQDARGLEDRARALRTEGEALLSGARPSDPEDRKHGGWERIDVAEEVRGQARRRALEASRLLHLALEASPDLPEAHAAFAARLRAVQDHAEARGDLGGALDASVSLRHHVDALPPAHPERVRAERWLDGRGALTLFTDPPGAEVLLYRVHVHRRRLREVFERALGTTPLDAIPVERGSWVCVIRLPGHDDVRYPVHIGREEHWTGVSPGERAPVPVALPPAGTLGGDELWVPPGPALTGRRPGRLRSVWVDGFVVRRHPVTNAEYLTFLNALMDRGEVELAARCVPRERPGTLEGHGAMIFALKDGRFELGADADGDVWQPDWPVICVDLEGSRAFAASCGGRLPYEAEWEKAARGVDGRTYPWGDHFDASWTCSTWSHTGSKAPVGRDAFPVDTSVYGVRHMAGNVRERCLDPFTAPPGLDPFRAPRIEAPPGVAGVIRGGSWGDAEGMADVSARAGLDPHVRGQRVGFRVFRDGP